MKSQAILVALLAVAFLSTIGTVGQTAIFTWTGGSDLDWDTPANWVGGIAPIQTDMGGAPSATWNTLQFIGTTMPTSNVKELGYDDEPYYTARLELNSGGTLSMGLWSGNNGLCSNAGGSQTMLIVGDGIGGGTEDVTLQFTESLLLNRHSGTFTTLVNQDGVLDVQGTLTMTYNNTRTGILDIVGGSVTADRLDMVGNYEWEGGSTRAELSDGGSFTIDGTVIDTMLTRADSVTTIRFQDKSSTYFMAQYGGDLPDLTTVQSALGSVFVSETDWKLVAESVDADGTENPAGLYFMVTAVPEPGCLALCAIGALCLLTGRRRKR